MKMDYNELVENLRGKCVSFPEKTAREILGIKNTKPKEYPSLIKRANELGREHARIFSKSLLKHKG